MRLHVVIAQYPIHLLKGSFFPLLYFLDIITKKKNFQMYGFISELSVSFYGKILVFVQYCTIVAPRTPIRR